MYIMAYYNIYYIPVIYIYIYITKQLSPEELGDCYQEKDLRDKLNMMGIAITISV